ncbi:thioether cross-link-forming SCIFF peptide maturase [Vallitalea okinawensis]|uniref:thioether cross-link-forming SCIFF peptide maturase n=1 Tax=Vallitalea okinawensis TaxID=2078660 RepID=UPI000CFAD999|nr:thioether cross-link-forming SCIFF peptide maturase [Vallitalea okinawensis]
MIHQYKLGELNIVMDIYSGAVHVVDELVYDLIQDYEKKSEEVLLKEYSEDHSKEVLLEALEEIKALKDEGLLFSEDEYGNVLQNFENRETVVKALCLHIAHDCNLSCRYCFAGEGEYHGDRSMMSAEVGKKAIDFLIAHSGNRRNLEIDFFGGEPLMNFGVVKEIVEYGRSLEKEHNKNFRFTMTTNGILLNDEITAYLNEHMHNVVLSIDGRKEINDLMRPSSNGKGSYDIIVDKFKKVAETRNQMDYYVRGTFTSHNLDFANDVLHLADLGFKQVSVEPVVASDDMPYALKEEHLPQLFEQYEKLADEMVKRRDEGKGFNFFHFMIDLNQGPCVAKRLSGCGSGCEYMAVTPWGDLYPCHQFVGLDEFKMGDVNEGITNEGKLKAFKATNVYTKPECKECWAKFYCSGGCSANSFQFYGDINRAYKVGCELEKKRVECAIMMKAKQMLAE